MYLHLRRLLEQNYRVKNQLVQTYLRFRDGNPSVVNAKFRKILEGIGFDYHKKGYSPKEIAYRIDKDDWGDHHCIMCGTVVTNFHSFETGFANHCSSKCSGKNPDTLVARKKSCLQKYGTENVFQSAHAKKKMKETFQEKFGVDSYQQSTEFSDRIKAAYINKSDDEMADILKKRKKTNVEKFGVEFPLQSDGKYQQLKETCLKKYGVEHPNQRPGFQPTKFRGMTQYKFPSGAVSNVQGFEPWALDDLLTSGIQENEILVSNRPSIKYFWPSTDGHGDDRWHRYHPDIILPCENKIIEVKSGWTFSGKEKWLSANLAKKVASIAAGYKFEFWIYTKQRSKTII